MNKNKQIDGYYIMGKYQSAAFCKTEEEAKVLCKKLNYGMNSGYYKVEPSYKY